MMMKRPLLACAIALAAVMVFYRAPLTRQLHAEQADKQQKPEMKLKVGDTAPDFTLLAFDGKQVTPVSLHDYKGKKNVALAFYVFAFTGG
jgi:cytochrome oxidase Cu insertion factor (SCO1/SenC/PrrC family)